MSSVIKRDWIYAALLLLIVLLALMILAGPATDGNSVKVEGIVFNSSSASPLEIVPRIAAMNSFIVSPVLVEGGTENGLMFNASALFLVVLSGNQKEVIHLIRVVDSEQNLLYCATNMGDLTKELELSAEDCEAILLSEDKALILIEQPSPLFEKPVVFVGERMLKIQVGNIELLGQTCLTVLKAMFPNNAQEIIAKSNQLTSLLS